MLFFGAVTGPIFVWRVFNLTNDKEQIIHNIEKILSEILSDKHNAIITIKFSKQ